MRTAALVAAGLVACSSSSATPPVKIDAAVAVTPDGGPHSAADVAACEQSLAATRPSVGLGSASARASYEQVIGKLMTDYDVPGGAITVSHNGELVLALGLGFADRDGLQPAHADDRFRVASLSKQITATAILHLVAAGQLSLDDKPFAILSDLAPIPGKTANPALQEITVRELLQHTGGWNRDHDAAGDPMFDPVAIAAAVPGAATPASCETIIRYMLDQPLAYAPGTTMCYSNFGYCVLGEVIARRAGMAYADYVQQVVLAPAGASGIAQGRTLAADRADGEVIYYDYPGAPLADSVFPSLPGSVPWPYGGFNLEAMAAHGAWIASPVDFLRFQLRIDGLSPPSDLLTPAQRDAMLADPEVPSCNPDGSTTPENADTWYGLGLEVNTYGNAWHTGSLPGTSTEDVIASNGYSWAAFFNTRPADATFFTDLDNDLWTAFSGVTTWSTQDYFDQYVAFSDWMSAADYAANPAAAGHYAVRVEGRLAAGATQLRAQIAPLHIGMVAATVTDVDCLDFVAAREQSAQSGLALVSLQSFVDGAGQRRFQATWATPK